MWYLSIPELFAGSKILIFCLSAKMHILNNYGFLSWREKLALVWIKKKLINLIIKEWFVLPMRVIDIAHEPRLKKSKKVS